MGPLPLRTVQKKLRTLGCTCVSDGASRYKVCKETAGETIVFWIEISHGKRTKRGQIDQRNCRKICNKLGITKNEWDAI